VKGENLSGEPMAECVASDAAKYLELKLILLALSLLTLWTIVGVHILRRPIL